MPPITGMDEIDITEGEHDEEATEMDEERREEGDEAEAQGEEADLQEEDDEEEGHDEEEGDEAVQLPLEKWSEHKLAEAGIELANHLHKLKVYEEAERKHKKHYKENHDRMVDVIEGLRLRIREQRHALGIDEGPEPGDEEEE